MQITPSQAFGDVKEALVRYLETQYRISHPAVFAERSGMLRRRATVAQAPFIEATPAFPTARKLAELERSYPEIVPEGISELVEHGVPVDRFALYTHQEKSLLGAFGDRPNLLVATGTGSGKTESFLLPILSDILHEAASSWVPPSGEARRGRYDAGSDVWLHSRRDEQRSAAIRAIILYPMNALVNDQLTRLRRILARESSPEWQRKNLKGNVIHFGMYTGLTKRAGSYRDRWRREDFQQYMEGVQKDWEKLREDLRDTGGWPKPDSPEMLCRWDMQAAPPDILVTNYSMLEYMLVRPIENPMFEATRRWLQSNPDARLTLVVDEAHTYTGAKGTEVAHLIRRLKERLGLEAGSDKFRAIATSASIPNIAGADDRLLQFTSDLFGEPSERFSLIRLPRSGAGRLERRPEDRTLRAFASFHDTFDLRNPWPAIERLAEDLGLGSVETTVAPSVSLYKLLEDSPDVTWVRERTARNATLLDQLAEECWEGLGTSEERELATAGVLAAGSFARAEPLPDTPPLLSMRVHGFFRGISGLWACMDPECRKSESDEERPVGKLYSEPRPWCECGARVLELFSCRHCGLLFLGGIPDNSRGSLWPWSNDLSGERQDVREFRIFGVERPGERAGVSHRSTRTTLEVPPGDRFARVTYEEFEPATNDGVIVSPFPNQCPRCRRHRPPENPERRVRELVEPLRTRGPQSFAVIVDNSFRNQPRSSGRTPNYGRKALLFSDSRQEAAILAADLRNNHRSDLFRQLLYGALLICRDCGGRGAVEEMGAYRIGQPQEKVTRQCSRCGGSGKDPELEPLRYAELRDRVLKLQHDKGIDPTGGDAENYFTRLNRGDASCYEKAELHFNVALRREVTEDRFSLEPLGLANWRVELPEDTGAFEPFNQEETKLFIQLVARLLATEDVVLPPEPYQPWQWPDRLVEEYVQNVLIPGSRRSGRAIPYNFRPSRKLGRYVIAISEALVREGRLPNEAAAERWRNELYWPLWDALKGFNVLQWAGAKVDNKVPFGIRLDSFVLHPLGGEVSRCRSCAYVMSEALLGMCVRCGQNCERVSPAELQNYYRLAALYARPDSPFDDPHPLRASEHTAQIQTNEARNEERWFQDMFHDDQEPLDHRVDVLSVTTTMEMGIDIGSLLFVGLRNVPPTVANYQQRAGRAGRRGSALATVFTYAQDRSHDQYYFASPPEIVSDPPRVPALHMDNEAISRRHVRSLVLQQFFLTQNQSGGAVLFEAWGTVADFIRQRTGRRMLQYVGANRAPLVERCKKVVRQRFLEDLSAWIQQIPNEVQRVAASRPPRDQLFEALINSGLLPKYAFPVDVVSLTMPDLSRNGNGEADYSDAMQRELRIAIAEYAPGAEVVKQDFPETYKWRSVGVHDPFARDPDYAPTGVLVECPDCRTVTLLDVDSDTPDLCEECGSPDVMAYPYLRPRGFTVDGALSWGGRERYERTEGRERSGYASPARLLLGGTSFGGGTSRGPFAQRLYTQVRLGDLVITNAGPDSDFPGYLICHRCGRSIDPDNLGSHKHPANVPPHWGRSRGPRAGDWCENRTEFTNQVILAHRFYSEIILLGTDLLPDLDAPFNEASGRAVWYSFGTLVANAATRVLQIDPGELKTGVRAVLREPGRLHGEVFLYDDVPGGAGYARAVDENVQTILEHALDLGHNCPNPDCPGACYRCLLDYGNQALHPLLDRELGSSVLEYLLRGSTPQLAQERLDACGVALAEYARAEWDVLGNLDTEETYLPCVLEDPETNERVGLWVIHPLSARPTQDARQRIHAEHGVRCAVHTAFDLERRPFWVLNNLVGT